MFVKIVTTEIIPVDMADSGQTIGQMIDSMLADFSIPTGGTARAVDSVTVDLTEPTDAAIQAERHRRRK